PASKRLRSCDWPLSLYPPGLGLQWHDGKAIEGTAMRRLCVFCGSRAGNAEVYSTHAIELARLLAARGIGLVYGGGHIGLMGVLADAMLAAGVEVIGVIPRGLVDRELAHRCLSDLHVVETMHQRKALMAELSDAVAAL